MANKRLSLEDIQQMKSMVLKGAAPEDIANHFKIAISSVHNYKQRFRQEGLKFPDVRGKRPTGSVEIQSRPVTPTTVVQEKTTATVQGGMNVVVNGVSVQISGEAKNVNVSKDHIEITF